MNKEQIKFVESILKSKEVKIQGVKIDLTEEQLQKLQQLVEPKYKNPFARVGEGEKYYYISELSGKFEVIEIAENFLDSDNKRFKSCNYYNNKEFAEQVAMDMNLQQMLRKFTYENGWNDEFWEIDDLSKFYIVFTGYDKCWRVACSDYHQNPFAVYFKEYKTAELAIEEVVKPFCKENPNYRFQEE